MRPLDEKTLVGGQILPEQMQDLAAQGVTTLINNRPDFEAPNQPTSADLKTAAEAAGIAYHHIPVAGGFSQGQVESMSEALASSQGKVVAFCLSGTRSTYLWALARATQGADAETLIGQAAAAGYDLRPIAGYLAPRG